MKKFKLNLKKIFAASLISAVSIFPTTAHATYPVFDSAVYNLLLKMYVLHHETLGAIAYNQKVATQGQNANNKELQAILVREKNQRDMFKNAYELEQKYQAPSISAGLVAEVADVANKANADITAQKNKYSSTLLHRKLNSELNFMEKTRAYAQARDLYAPNGNMPNADISIDSILTGSGKAGKSENLTFNQQQIDAGARYIMNAVSANIPPPLPLEMQKTEKGQNYEIARREALSKMSLSQKIHTDALAYRTPVNSLGNSGKQISHAEFITNQINSRYGNKNWLVGLESGSDIALFKELLYIKALELKMREQELEHLEKISLGIAQLLDNSSSPQLENLRSMRESAIKQGVLTKGIK